MRMRMRPLILVGLLGCASKGGAPPEPPPPTTVQTTVEQTAVAPAEPAAPSPGSVAPAPEAPPAPEPVGPAVDPVPAPAPSTVTATTAAAASPPGSLPPPASLPSRPSRSKSASPSKPAAVPVAYSGPEPCMLATKGTSPVARACAEGGVSRAKAVMKDMVRRGKAAGVKVGCDDCHADDADYAKLTLEAEAKFRELLAALGGK